MRGWLVLVALIGCRHRPVELAAEAPVAATPEPLVAADVDRPVTFVVETPAYRPAEVATRRTADLVFPSDGEMQIVRGDVDISGGCADVCVVDQVAPGEVLRLSHTEGRSITVQALAEAPNGILTLGEPERIEVTAVSPGDPRGRFAQAGFRVPTATAVTLSVTPVHHTDHVGQHGLSMEVYGPSGRVQAHEMGRGKGGRVTHTLRLVAGDYTVRVRPFAPERLDQLCAEVDGFRGPPDLCDPRADELDFPVDLLWEASVAEEVTLEALAPASSAVVYVEEQPVTVQIAPHPGPSVARLPLVAGLDLSLAYDPPDASVQLYTTSGGESWRSCFGSPCVTARVEAEWFDVLVFPVEEARALTFEATATAPPAALLELEPGYVATLSLVQPSEPSLGAMAEITLKIPRAGEFLVATLTTGEPMHHLEVFAPDGLGVSPSMTNVLGGGDGYSAERFVFDAPGAYVLRVGGEPGDLPQELKVGLETVD